MGSVQGLDELIATLSSLGGNVVQSCVRGSKKTSMKIVKNVKMNLTTNESVDTGLLRASVHSDTQIVENEINSKVTNGVDYGVYPEFGTGQRGATSNVDRPSGLSYRADWKGMTAKPYMTPAYLHAKSSNMLEEEVTKEVQNEINKLGSGK